MYSERDSQFSAEQRPWYISSGCSCGVRLWRCAVVDFSNVYYHRHHYEMVLVGIAYCWLTILGCVRRVYCNQISQISKMTFLMAVGHVCSTRSLNQELRIQLYCAAYARFRSTLHTPLTARIWLYWKSAYMHEHVAIITSTIGKSLC